MNEKAGADREWWGKQRGREMVDQRDGEMERDQLGDGCMPSLSLKLKI